MTDGRWTHIERYDLGESVAFWRWQCFLLIQSEILIAMARCGADILLRDPPMLLISDDVLFDNCGPFCTRINSTYSLCSLPWFISFVLDRTSSCSKPFDFEHYQEV